MALSREQTLLWPAYHYLAGFPGTGFLLIFTEGSSQHFPTIGWVGGYGVYSEAGVELSDFLPLHMKQTINSAELLAALTDDN